MALISAGGTGKAGQVVLVEFHGIDVQSFVQSEPLSSSGEELSCTKREGHFGLAAVVLSMTSNFELQAARSCASYSSEIS